MIKEGKRQVIEDANAMWRKMASNSKTVTKDIIGKSKWNEHQIRMVVEWRSPNNN